MNKDKNSDHLPGSWSQYTVDEKYVRQVRLEASRIRRRIAGAPIEKQKLKNLDAKQIKELIDQRRARRKHAQKVARQFIAKRRMGIVTEQKNGARAFEYKSALILDEMVPRRKELFKTSPSRSSRRKFATVELKDMSFTHNPRQTMKRLSKIVERDCDTRRLRIDFHDQYCLDVGPFLILSSMWKDLQVPVVGGDISNSMGKVLSALEIDQELDMEVPELEDRYLDVYGIPIMNRRRSGTTTSETRFLDQQTYEKIAGNLAGAIDGWLGITASQQLNKNGRRNVLKLVTETLNNAERHGDIFKNENDGDWAVGAFMAKREDAGQKVFRCHLAFLSTGTTIEETISTAEEPTQSAMQDYVAKHSGRIGSRKHTDAHLRTVYALQDGVTRSAEALSEKRNGTGFQDILHFYSDLAGGNTAKSDPSLAIVSGHTCVLCNKDYMHGTRMFGDDSERELWFNASNDQNLPPDSCNIVELEQCLKGTLISMAFTLDLDYLERTVDGAN